MAGLADVLRSLAAREGVQAALLLSGEGLPIDHAAAGPFEAETRGRAGGHARTVRRRDSAKARRWASSAPRYSTSRAAVRAGPAGGEDWLAVLARSPTPTSDLCSTTSVTIGRLWPGSCDAPMRWAVLLAGGPAPASGRSALPRIPNNCFRSPARAPAPRTRSRSADGSDPPRAHAGGGRRRSGPAAAGTAGLPPRTC